MAASRVAGHHSPLFKIDPEPSVRLGIEAMTAAVLDLLAHKELNAPRGSDSLMARKSRDWQDEEEEAPPVVHCWLCGREMGERDGVAPPHTQKPGRESARVPVHPICHRTIHANFTNSDLGKTLFNRQTRCLAHDEIGRFVAWIANKPPDFNAPTKDRSLALSLAASPRPWSSKASRDMPPRIRPKVTRKAQAPAGTCHRPA